MSVLLCCEKCGRQSVETLCRACRVEMHDKKVDKFKRLEKSTREAAPDLLAALENAVRKARGL